MFGRVAAEARLLDLIWSEPLLAEASRVLTERKPVPSEVAARWIGYLRQAFPGGELDLDRLDPAIDLPAFTSDPNDHHVCALAIVGEADLLLTFDRGYLRKELAAHGINVLSPDAFLSTQIDNEPEVLRTVITERRGRMSSEAFCSHLDQVTIIDRLGHPCPANEPGVYSRVG